MNKVMFILKTYISPTKKNYYYIILKQLKYQLSNLYLWETEITKSLPKIIVCNFIINNLKQIILEFLQ